MDRRHRGEPTDPKGGQCDEDDPQAKIQAHPGPEVPVPPGVEPASHSLLLMAFSLRNTLPMPLRCTGTPVQKARSVARAQHAGIRGQTLGSDHGLDPVGQVAWTLWFAGCTAEVAVTGNSRRNVDPLLSLDSTQMRPPMRLTSSLQM